MKNLSKILIIISNIIFGLSLPVWFFGLGLVAMMFDAPGSLELWYLRVAMNIYLFYPIVVLISIVLSMKFKSLWWRLLPLGDIILFLGIIFIFWK